MAKTLSTKEKVLSTFISLSKKQKKCPSNAEIGAKVGVHQETVRNHMQSLLKSRQIKKSPKATKRVYLVK